MSETPYGKYTVNTAFSYASNGGYFYYKVICSNCLTSSCASSTTEAYVDGITVNKVNNCAKVDCSTASLFSIADKGLTTLVYTDDTLTPSFSFNQPVTNNACCQMIFTGPYTD